MKKLAIAFLLLALAGCQASDKEIRADIAGKAQQDLDFAGLHYTVKNGVVQFTGRVHSEKAYAKIQQIIQSIHVIKEAKYNVLIAPVVLDTLTEVKLVADSITASYPLVIADVHQHDVTLKGAISSNEKSGLIKAIRAKYKGEVKDSLQAK